MEACVNTGTHYLDMYVQGVSTSTLILELYTEYLYMLSSGEPPWYKEIIDKFDERAKANKAIVR